MLAYLALRRTPVLRSQLDSLLWPESDRNRARRSLREELSLLRQHLPTGVLKASGQSVELDPASEVDVWSFTSALAKGAWESAATIYSGELLEGIFVRNAAAFEVWLEDARERLKHQYVETLQVLCAKAVAAGEIGAALAYNQQIIAANPFAEEPYLRSMKWAMQMGEIAVALDVYHHLQLVLKREFGLQPSPAAVSLAKEIAAGAHGRHIRLPEAVTVPTPAAAEERHDQSLEGW